MKHQHKLTILGTDQAQNLIDEIFQIYIEQKIIRSVSEKEMTSEEIALKDKSLVENWQSKGKKTGEQLKEIESILDFEIAQ